MTCSATRSDLAKTMIVAICTIIISGCASQQAIEQNDVMDPFEPVNRAIFRFNQVADKYALRPVAKGYQFIAPSIVRTGVNNFFDNISYPVDIINAALQGKFKQAGLDTARLFLNTTVGLLGILDPATEAGLVRHNEDFGQTLGVWGVPQGPYLMLPFFGPRTLRSGAGSVADAYVNPQFRLFSSSVRTKVNLFWVVHERSTLIGIDKEVERAFDPYTFVRDAYQQNREYLRYDGNPPEQEFDFEDEDFEDDFDE